MFNSSASSKKLFQSIIHCSASRIQTINNLGHYQITTLRSSRLRTQKYISIIIYPHSNHYENLHQRFKRRDIKVEIDVHLFYHIEEPVPTIHHPLYRLGNPKFTHIVGNFQIIKSIPIRLRILKIDCHNRQLISK